MYSASMEEVATIMEEVATICCRRDIQDTRPPHMNTTVPEIERRGPVAIGVGMHVQRISIVYETEVGRASCHPSARRVGNSQGDRYWRRSTTKDRSPLSLRDYDLEWNLSRRQSKIPASGSVHRTMGTHRHPRWVRQNFQSTRRHLA
jgi:hypothetical protein